MEDILAVKMVTSEFDNRSKHVFVSK